MKKNLLRSIGIIGTLSMLAGCTTSGSSPILEEIKLPNNGSPAKISNESVLLSKDVQTLMIEKTELSDISDEQRACLSNASIALLNRISKDDKGNVLISPYSINTALGMTELGAGNETLKQMEETVNGGLSRSEFETIMYRLREETVLEDQVKWNTANSLWLKDDGRWALRDEFLTETVSYYDPEIYKAPFNDQTLKDINSWVSNETDKKITQILDKIDPRAVLYLVNATAFEAEWETMYEEDDIFDGRTFTNADNSSSEVTMLTSTENRYFTLGKGEGFIKPYKGGRFAYVAILPEEGMGTDEYLEDLAASKEDFSKAVREADYESVIVHLPEYSMDYDVKLHEVYKNMGMDIPFDENKADFHDMITSTAGEPYNVWIGRILHKTHIEVDRKGTKAAAATVVEMNIKCQSIEVVEEPKIIVLDRPFVYAIVETETGIPFFIGCQNTMSN